ncbi:hypothetical protein ACTXT7_005176 [Hymenolepis weldensis]
MSIITNRIDKLDTFEHRRRVELPITSETNVPSEPIETTKNTSPGIDTPTQQMATIGQSTPNKKSDNIGNVLNCPETKLKCTLELILIGMISTNNYVEKGKLEKLSVKGFEDYQKIDTPDDEPSCNKALCPPSAPNESDATSTSSSETASSDDWVRFTMEEIEELKSSGRESPISQDYWVLVEELNEYKGDDKSNILNPECIEEDCPDICVFDYFQSARKEDSWQCHGDVKIKPSDIGSVRRCLGDLSDFSDDEVRDALRFVHSGHQYPCKFFDRPPPNCRMNTLSDWHYLYAARALTLRHVYAIALHMTFNQCLETLSSSDWNFSDVRSKIVL